MIDYSQTGAVSCLAPCCLEGCGKVGQFFFYLGEAKRPTREMETPTISCHIRRLMRRKDPTHAAKPQNCKDIQMTINPEL